MEKSESDIISSHRTHRQQTRSTLPCCTYDCKGKQMPNSTASPLLFHHQGLELGLIFAGYETCHTDNLTIPFGDPHMFRADQFQVLVEEAARVSSAYARVVIDMTVPLREIVPKAPTRLEVFRFVLAYSSYVARFHSVSNRANNI